MIAEQIQEIVPNLVFMKTVKKVTTEELSEENFIFEEDTPVLDKVSSVVMPIPVNTYPRICSMATASEIGGWLLTFCFEMKLDWNKENFEYCLSQAENGFKNQEE